MNNLRKLRTLESSQQFLFHGSGLRLNVIEPRQAFTDRGDGPVADGPPAVFTSEELDYAIFMALINPETCPAGLSASVSYEGNGYVFAASTSTLDQLHPRTTGFVHVVKRQTSHRRNQAEWICHHPIKPVFVVQVKLSDFRQPIARYNGTD